MGTDPAKLEELDPQAVAAELAEASSARLTNTEAFGQDRAPFIITTEQNLAQSIFIYLKINPNEVSFQQGIRATDQKTRTGVVQHVWRDTRRGTVLDEIVLGFQFQAGNTIPLVVKNADGTETVTMPAGLENFTEMIQLLDQNRVLEDGRPNFVYIIYNSRNFPNITLIGFFESQGFSWTDSADNPTGLTWTANFTVHDSYPRFNNAAELKKVFQLYSYRGLAAGSRTSDAPKNLT